MENNQKTEKISFYTERKSALVQASVIFMLLSAMFRLVGCWGRWNDAFFAATQIALPLACNLLFILLVLTLGRRALWTTVLPVLLGVVFFIIKSFTFDSILHTILCILLYLLVAVLYTGTVFGRIRTKWLCRCSACRCCTTFLWKTSTPCAARTRRALMPACRKYRCSASCCRCCS